MLRKFVGAVWCGVLCQVQSVESGVEADAVVESALLSVRLTDAEAAMTRCGVGCVLRQGLR